MSSKFSNTTQTQKPPHICIKPPPGPDYIPPPITIQDIGGYVQYYDPSTPSEGGMISFITLYPIGPPNTWSGEASAGIYRTVLTMRANPTKTAIAFTLEWFVSDSLEDTIHTDFRPPRSWTPFDSGEIQPFPQPYHGRIGFHLWF